ncbi:MAG: ABC transporter substrate-binding protein [Rhodospirillales bacterium]
MDIDDTIKRLRNRDLSRRDLGKALGAVGLTAAMMPLLPKTGHASEEDAIYYTWAGYDVPEMWPAYVEKYGDAPQLPTFGDTQEAFTKIRAGFTVDVVHPCSNNVQRWRNADLLQPIDTSRLSNWPDVIPSLKNVDNTQIDGKQWFVPWEWGQTSVTYRTDLFDLEGKEESWGMLWDERYAGRLSIIDAAGDSWWCAAIYAGVDFNNVTDADMKKVMDLLRKQQQLLRFRQSDSTTLVQALATGEVVAAMTWSDVPTALVAEGVPVKFADVKEGGLTWVCGVVLMKDAPHYDRAHDLIDALLSPESGRFCIGVNAYGHCNAKSFDLFSEEELRALSMSKNPTKLLESGVFLIAQPEEIEQKINRDWGDLISEL